MSRRTHVVIQFSTYIEELLPAINLDAVPDGYRAMNDRESIKVSH
jgi:hypothetical protein